MQKIIPPVRGTDSQGSGYFGAPRGTRLHNGIDYACPKGSVILSPVAGTYTKLGWPYNPEKYQDRAHMRYVQITDGEGLRHRFFYVATKMEIGADVVVDQPIGYTQGLLDIFEGITDHYHYEIMAAGQRKYLDPDDFE